MVRYWQRKRLKDQVNLERKDRSFLLHAPWHFHCDRARYSCSRSLSRLTETHTERLSSLELFWGKGTKKWERMENKQTEKKRSGHAGCGSVLWLQTNTVSAVAGVIAAPQVSYIDGDPHNDVQAWKAPGSQRVEVERGGREWGSEGGEGGRTTEGTIDI